MYLSKKYCNSEFIGKYITNFYKTIYFIKKIKGVG